MEHAFLNIYFGLMLSLEQIHYKNRLSNNENILIIIFFIILIIMIIPEIIYTNNLIQ